MDLEQSKYQVGNEIGTAKCDLCLFEIIQRIVNGVSVSTDAASMSGTN